MDLLRLADANGNPVLDANGNPLWQIIHMDIAANILAFAQIIQANLAQLQADAGQATPPSPPPPPPPTPVTTGFRGVFAFNNMDNPSLFVDNPYVFGTTLTRYWRELNPQPGVYNWALFDNDMASWIKAGKSVILRVSASGWKPWQPAQDSAHGTPQWVFDQGVQSVTDDDGSVKPEYWNPKFLSALSTFVQAFAARYDGHPNVTCIEIGVGDGGETKVDTSKVSDVLSKWKAIGYTDAAWWGAIQQIITLYTQAFAKTPLAIMPDASFIGGTPGYNEQKVISFIAGLKSRTVWIQDNGLAVGRSLPSSFSVLSQGWPLLSEQRADTATSGDSLDGDISTALSQGALAILIFSSDLQQASNQAILAKYAAQVGK